MSITIAQWLAGCPLPRLEGRLLLQHVSGLSHSALIAHDDRLLREAEITALQELCRRRSEGEPIAYLLGQRDFYGRAFSVSPDVLIPRPETEHLLEAALFRLPENGRLWDLGTGSGIVAVSAKLERPDAEVYASDISAAALAVARHNAANLGAEIIWGEGSWFDAVFGGRKDFRLPENRFDVLVSNPPYIASGDKHLQQGDLRFEPPQALTDFSDGLQHIRTLTTQAHDILKNGGWLLLEHGYEQGSAVRELMRNADFQAVETLTDWAGLDRITLGRRPL